jgi:hypothetical protein
MKDGKSIYKKLRKKYGLPKLEELVREFAVKIEDPDLVFHEIVDKIKDRMHECAKILESIIFVTTTSDPSSMYETKMLEEKKNEAFEIFKRLMSIAWKGVKVEASGDDKEMASFIKQTYKDWNKSLKNKFIDLCESLEKQWKDASLRESPKEMMYLG